MRLLVAAALSTVVLVVWADEHPPGRQAFFGDTHIHTNYSMDAFMAFSVRATPDDAYRYAKGEAIAHTDGSALRISGPPLDFLMVSDHGGFLGVHAALSDPTSPTYGHREADRLQPLGGTLSDVIVNVRRLAAAEHELMGRPVIADAWQKIVAAAQRHNDPGRFTTFIGYEYTPSPGSRHLHRNVIFRGEAVPDVPFTSRDSDDPEDLWNWLDALRQDGMEAFAIPHNMNQSDGLAFMTQTWKSEPINKKFAQKRKRNEPIAEISQQKGTSETHPSLSPNDEWADFQIVQYYLNRRDNTNPVSIFKGSYWRDALKTGLQFKSRLGVNPFQLGAIASSDSHLGAAAYEEENYFTVGPNTPVARGAVYPRYQDPEAGWEDFWTPRQATHGTGGIAGVWAEENTRTSLYDAMRRRETFATSGPRMRVRFFGGFDLPAEIDGAGDRIAQAYQHGVPMGGVLTGNGTQSAPSFVVQAMRDPHAGWLQRVQVVKGWLVGDTLAERVYDVACSDGLQPDPDTQRCPDNGAAVNLADCSISRGKGAVALHARWQDPDFRPDAQAFYYVRVLENPSCRWSTWDALRLGVTPNPDLQATQQERAWSSPIWYEPAAD
ncbi:MAG: DUF3604 domain-containing protein [Pseudomonadota bacterium]